VWRKKLEKVKPTNLKSKSIHVFKGGGLKDETAPKARSKGNVKRAVLGTTRTLNGTPYWRQAGAISTEDEGKRLHKTRLNARE
jgi:hypothetical protein